MPFAPTPDDIAAARRALVAADPALVRVDAQTPPLEWRLRVGGFEGLFRMIVEQQVSVASAAQNNNDLNALFADLPEATRHTVEIAMRRAPRPMPSGSFISRHAASTLS